MPDREKVINALGRCESYGYCEDMDCPYSESVRCLELLRKDALALLLEKRPVEPHIEHEVPVIIYDNEFGTGVWCDCGNCGETLIVLKDTNTEAASQMIRYCRKCGKAVKWE